MKLRIAKQGALALLTFATLNAFAASDLTPEEGFKRLDTNIQNSKHNQEEYKKNIDVTHLNIAEVVKAKEKLTAQKKEVQTSINSHDKIMESYRKRGQELDTLANKEQQKITDEKAKILVLEAMLATLKANQDSRAKNIQAYQEQKLEVETLRKSGDTRKAELKGLAQKLDSQLSEVKKEEGSWRSKDKAFNSELVRWQKEEEVQTKLQGDMKSLAESKD